MQTMKFAKIFGWILLIIGILGFVPGITSGGKLLGIFEVDAMHNIIHVASGVVALMMSKSEMKAKMFFKIFGVIYAVVTVFGFVGSDNVLGIFGVNLADNLLHTIIALVALYFGFMGKKSMMSSSTNSNMGGGSSMM